MQAQHIHADRTIEVLACAGSLPWLASPQPGVERRMLERVGAEVAVATTLVRYAPGSSFSPHTHALGEEFLVLSGTFADEHGEYGPGTYVRNPPGSSHRPFSGEGCTLFVKLRQMDALESRRVVVAVGERSWVDVGTALHRRALLYAGRRETVFLERLEPGCTMAAQYAPGGQEMLVLDGAVRVAGVPGRQGPGAGPRELGPLCWLRNPLTRQPALTSPRGALLWIKRGHVLPLV
jgi:quercetin dioxygenase-like cupin family protein